jgi:VIT1/CCC1 family predicted Fe2+/Mn2+ transporter
MADAAAHGMVSMRFLDPLERTLEALFGVIMVVVFTGSISITDTAGDVRDVLIAAIGCNVAWGVVDAAMYLMATFAERSRGLTMLNAIRSTPEATAAHGAIANLLPSGLAAMLTAQEFEAVRRRLTALAESPRPALVRDDYLGALGVFMLVFVSTLPIVTPFILVNDVKTAIRISQLIAIVLLFAMGWRLGAYAGRPPLRTGLTMVVIGAMLSVLTYVLGG